MKNWMERVEKKSKLNSTKGTTGKSHFVEHMPFRFHTKNWMERVEKKSKLNSTKGTTGKSNFSFPQPSLALTLFLSNTAKERNRENSQPALAHEPELRKTYLHFVEISILNQYFSVAGLREWNLWLEMSDSLITSDALIGWMQSQGRFWPHLWVHFGSLRLWSLVKMWVKWNRTHLPGHKVSLKCT